MFREWLLNEESLGASLLRQASIATSKGKLMADEVRNDYVQGMREMSDLIEKGVQRGLSADMLNRRIWRHIELMRDMMHEKAAQNDQYAHDLANAKVSEQLSTFMKTWDRIRQRRTRGY